MFKDISLYLILPSSKQVFTPSPRNYGDVISAAMAHGDAAAAWALYDELIERGLSPHEETWDALFKGARETEEDKGKEAGAVSQTEHQEKLLGILLHMRNNQIYPQRGLASSIKAWFERYARATLRVRGESGRMHIMFPKFGSSVFQTSKTISVNSVFNSRLLPKLWLLAACLLLSLLSANPHLYPK